MQCSMMCFSECVCVCVREGISVCVYAIKSEIFCVTAHKCKCVFMCLYVCFHLHGSIYMDLHLFPCIFLHGVCGLHCFVFSAFSTFVCIIMVVCAMFVCVYFVLSKICMYILYSVLSVPCMCIKYRVLCLHTGAAFIQYPAQYSTNISNPKVYNRRLCLVSGPEPGTQQARGLSSPDASAEDPRMRWQRSSTVTRMVPP
ncbi:unnamed protein product [Arctogadus glacialis]